MFISTRGKEYGELHVASQGLAVVLILLVPATILLRARLY